MTSTQYNSVLFDAQGNPLSVAGAVVAPGALNHAAVWELPGHLHPFRSDESLRQNPEDAKAMRRRAFHARLMQERCAQTIALQWKAVVPNPDDPAQKEVQDALAEQWELFPDKVNAHEQLLEMVWFGKAGLQVVWDAGPNGKTGVVYHEPVHGDSIQFDWAGTPVILVSQQSAKRFERQWPNSVLPPGEVVPEVVRGSDRGAYGLKLNHPALRRRFILSQFRREAADYFDGDMSGRIHGTGLRDRAFWTDRMLVNAEVGMLNFLFSTGMMDLLLFNYISGNDESRKAAQANAEKITGKLALLNPLPMAEYAKRGPVEQIPMNAAGVDALRGVIQDLYMVQEEHLFVGQSMSTGGGGPGGLEGDGRAKFAESTKTALQKTDAERLATTWTRDWAVPQRDYLFPGSTVPVRMVPILEDAEEKKGKFDRGVQLVQIGVPVEVEELRECAGFREPRPGKPTIGGAAPGMPGQPPAGPDGQPAAAAPNPALPPGDTTRPHPEPTPNPVLPTGTPAAAANPAAPNPALPPGNPVARPASAADRPAAQVSDDEAVDGIVSILAALNKALGVEAEPDREAVLAAVRQHTGGAVPYRAMTPPWPGAVFDEGKHRWVSGKGQDDPKAGRATTAAPQAQPAAGQQAAGQSVGPDAGQPTDADPSSVLSGLDLPELADPRTAAAARTFAARAYEAVATVLFNLSGPVQAIAEAILDTPEDMQKFAYNPSSLGTAGHENGDPIKAATGINAHLAMTIASKVLAFAFVRGKRALGYDADGSPVLYEWDSARGLWTAALVAASLPAA